MGFGVFEDDFVLYFSGKCGVVGFVDIVDLFYFEFVFRVLWICGIFMGGEVGEMLVRGEVLNDEGECFGNVVVVMVEVGDIFYYFCVVFVDYKVCFIFRGFDVKGVRISDFWDNIWIRV